MAVKLNNRGYVLVEIILASVIAFAIAYYMFDLTIKLKNKNDDLLVETLAMTDQAIIENKLMQHILEEKEDFDCNNILITGNLITYNDTHIDIVNKYTTIGELECSDSSDFINVYLPLNIEQIDKDFDVDIYYVFD